MSQRDPKIAFLQMKDFSEELLALTKGRTQEELEGDRGFQLAVLHLLDLLGEAAGRVFDWGTGRYPEFPWNGVKGLRNRIIHGYDEVDYDILWNIIDNEMNPLLDQLKKILENGPLE